MARSQKGPVLVGALVAGTLLGLFAPLAVVALVVVVVLVAALVLRVREVENHRRIGTGPAPLLAVGVSALVAQLVARLGLLAGVAAAVILVILVLLLGGDLG